MTANCPFCNLTQSQIIDSNEFGFVIRDGFPISLGHTLIIPKRHVGSFFNITKDEQNSLFELMARSQKVLIDSFNPDGFNVGINDGPAAGQTVPHLHIHLIPRFINDQEDPRDGCVGLFLKKQSTGIKS